MSPHNAEPHLRTLLGQLARALSLLLAAGCAAAGSTGARPGAAATAAAPAAPAYGPALELVETAPIGTVLDHPDLPEAATVWLEMIRRAARTLDFAEFYATNQPGSRLEPIVRAVEEAAERGVHVRFLADLKFARTQPETLNRLAAHRGIEVRRFDAATLLGGGGVLHAKYFLVDGQECYLGSQNFDWRSLTHIQELGVRVRVPAVARALEEVFDADWALAAGKKPPSPARLRQRFPITIDDGGERVELMPVFSPKGFVPDERLWELPRLVEMIDSASKRVRIQLLTYQAVEKGAYFADLESAIRRALARGVPVELMVSDWSKRSGNIEGLQSLQALPGMTVKLVTVPPWSGGFIPYARVIHAKYMVVDGRKLWIGTSNWERSYFYASRNVGLMVESEKLAQRLDRFFLDDWNGPYAARVDPCGSYQPPRTH